MLLVNSNNVGNRGTMWVASKKKEKKKKKKREGGGERGRRWVCGMDIGTDIINRFVATFYTWQELENVLDKDDAGAVPQHHTPEALARPGIVLQAPECEHRNGVEER
jgi:hypothetical protein